METSEEQPTELFLFLSPSTLLAVYPKIKELIGEDFEGGRYLAELVNLKNGIRSHLQHDDIWVD